MSSTTTFGAFTTARLGIYAAQKGLDVTGNNISNISTTGYTRQVLNQVSLQTGSADRYQSAYSVSVGNGVLCTSISQLRDPYLDIRYRNELSSVGSMDSKLDGLKDIADIVDEVGDGDGDGVIQKQFNDLVTQLQTLSSNVGEDEYETAVRSSASSLTQLFNSYADKLSDLEETTSDGFDEDLDKVNSLLSSIGELNDSIRSSEIHGDSALDQTDQRNELLDQLSQYVKIDVTYGTEDIGNGDTIDKLVVKLGGADSDSSTSSATLIDGTSYGQLSITSGSTNYGLTISALANSKGTTLDGSTAVNLADNDLYGSLQSTRELLTEKGEYSTDDEIAADSDAATKRGIPYYQKALDALANKFASVMNAANTVTAADGTVTAGGALFSNNGNGNDTTGITAENISVSAAWTASTVSILNSTDTDAASQDNTNILHMITLIDSDQTYKPSDVATGASDTTNFTGSFQEMLTNINSLQASDQTVTSTLLDNYQSSSDELYTSRDSVSGVDLNDEAANLMQYQKAYSAACRVMTTLDTALDKLINGTAV